MVWTARLTISRNSSPNGDIRHRKRRGEIICVDAVDSIPTIDWIFKHENFVFIFVRDVPEAVSLDFLKKKFSEPHKHLSSLEDGASPDDPDPHVLLARKKRFIPVGLLPNNHKDRLHQRGWTAFSFAQIRTAIRSRPTDIAPSSDDDAEENASIPDNLEG